MYATRKGFTLVEILIVVVILGILAAIVIPQFTSASESAKAGSLSSQVQTIRSQLELYQVQHGGTYPTLAQMWGNMTGYTNEAGATNASKSAEYKFGPYLQQAPANPFSPDATSKISVGAAAARNTAWAYDATTGAIRANVSLPGSHTTSSLGLSDNDVNVVTAAVPE